MIIKSGENKPLNDAFWGKIGAKTAEISQFEESGFWEFSHGCHLHLAKVLKAKIREVDTLLEQMRSQTKNKRSESYPIALSDPLEKGKEGKKTKLLTKQLNATLWCSQEPESQSQYQAYFICNQKLQNLLLTLVRNYSLHSNSII